MKWLLTVFLFVSISTSLFAEDIPPQAEGEFSADLFTPYLTCNFLDGLKNIQLDARSGANNYREITINGQVKKVSVIKGYRIIMGYSEDVPFVKIHVEQSDAKQYKNDVKVVRQEIDTIMKGIKKPLDRKVNNLQVYGGDNEDLESAKIMGMHLIFVPKDHMIVTIYFPNADPQLRKYNTVEEYQQLQSAFFNQYTACITAPPATAETTVPTN